MRKFESNYLPTYIYMLMSNSLYFQTQIYKNKPKQFSIQNSAFKIVFYTSCTDIQKILLSHFKIKPNEFSIITRNTF